jgi:hypothetical protein
MKYCLGAVGVCALLLAGASTAAGLAYKNPGHGFRSGEWSAGAIVVQGDRDMEIADQEGTHSLALRSTVGALGYGLADGMWLEGHAGSLRTQFTQSGSTVADTHSDGRLLGAVLRYHVSPNDDVLQHGLLVAYHTSFDLHNIFGESELTRLDAGYAASAKIAEWVTVYLGGVSTALELTETSSDGTSVVLESSEDVGAFGGLEFRAGNSMQYGLELHAVDEIALLLYLDSRF